MTAQTEKKGHSLINNVAVQMTVLVILAAVLIALAAKYIW